MDDLGVVRTRFEREIRAAGGFRAAAERLGCSVPYLRMLVSGAGDRRPALDMARDIEDAFGISMRAWSIPRERRDSTEGDQVAA